MLILSSNSPRFRFIDGLRGLAALSVLLHHAFRPEQFSNYFGSHLAGSMHALAEFGCRGVQVFFVLSGFVIALTFSDQSATIKSVANFFVRRQIRLSPAYWVCTLLAFSRIYSQWSAHPHALSKPHLNDLFLNAFYLNGIMQRPRFLGSAWTLCLEMQFYVILGFIGLLNCGARCGGPTTPGKRRDVGPFLIAVLGFISVWFHRLLQADMDSWWFTQTFNMFALGVLAYWAFSGRCRQWVFWMMLAAILGEGIAARQDGMIVAALTGLLLYVATVRKQLDRWLTWPAVQYLGTISYSLYLIHNEVLFHFSKWGIAFTGVSAISTIFWRCAGCGLSVVAAHALYVMIERPTRKASAAIKSGRRIEREIATHNTQQAPTWAPNPINPFPVLSLIKSPFLTA